jgi:isochorismate synthase
VISVLHPTPAVCGLPKQEKRILFWKMKDTTEYYTGFLGELNKSI